MTSTFVLGIDGDRSDFEVTPSDVTPTLLHIVGLTLSEAVDRAIQIELFPEIRSEVETCESFSAEFVENLTKPD